MPSKTQSRYYYLVPQSISSQPPTTQPSSRDSLYLTFSPPPTKPPTRTPSVRTSSSLPQKSQQPSPSLSARSSVSRHQPPPGWRSRQGQGQHKPPSVPTPNRERPISVSASTTASSPAAATSELRRPPSQKRGNRESSYKGTSRNSSFSLRKFGVPPGLVEEVEVWDEDGVEKREKEKGHIKEEVQRRRGEVGEGKEPQSSVKPRSNGTHPPQTQPQSSGEEVEVLRRRMEEPQPHVKARSNRVHPPQPPSPQSRQETGIKPRSNGIHPPQSQQSQRSQRETDMTSKGERGPSMGINGELDHKIEQPQNGVEEETVSKSGVEGGQDLSRSYSVSSHNTETSFETAETHIPSVSPQDSRPQQGKREDPRVVAEEETIVFPTEIRITPSPEPVPAYPSKAQNTPHQNISHQNVMDQNVTPQNNVDRDRRQTLRPPPLTLSRSSPITPISSAPSSASPTKLEYDALSSGSSSPTTPQKPHHHIPNSSDNTIQIFPPLLSSNPYNPSDISPSNRLGLTMERERQKRGVRVGVGEWERERERPEREAPILRERARESREVSFIPSPEMTGRQDGNGNGNGTAAKTGGLVLKKALEKGMKIADSLAGAAPSSSSPTEFVEGERERERGRHVDYTSGKPLPPLPPYARAHDSYHSHPPSSYTYTPPKSHSLPIHSFQGPNPYFPLSEAQPSSRPTSFPPVPPSSHFNTSPSHNTDVRVAPFLFQPSASPSGSGSVTEGGKGSGVRRRFSLRALFGREKDKEKGKGKMVETGGRRLVMSSEDYNAL